MRFATLIVCLFVTLSWSCRNSPKATIEAASNDSIPLAYSLLGKPLYLPNESPEVIHRKDSLLAIAQQNFNDSPDSLDTHIWLGRRTAYLYQYSKAIDIYTQALQQFSNAPELYRHRGHRYISIRQFDKAIADFERAARLAQDRPIEIEPDGIPNKLNQPLSSLQFNIWYHWALAYYLQGNFEKAAQLYERCMHYSTNPDLLVATTDWLYMTYRRMNETTKAQALLDLISPEMEMIENDGYHQRLLMYKGLLQPTDLLDLDNTDPDQQLAIVTQGYGVGNWYLINRDTSKAIQVYEKILETPYWPAFGYIAAEADLKRIR